MTTIDVPDTIRPIVSVDDDPGLQDLLAIVHTRRRVPNELVLLSSAHAAIDYLDQLARSGRPSPALLLVDINMPRMDGFELIEKLQAEPERFQLSETKICMLSSSAAAADTSRALALGVGYVEKPFNILALDFRTVESADDPQVVGDSD